MPPPRPNRVKSKLGKPLLEMCCQILATNVKCKLLADIRFWVFKFEPFCCVMCIYKPFGIPGPEKELAYLIIYFWATLFIEDGAI